MKVYAQNDKQSHMFQRFMQEVTNSLYKYFYIVQQVTDIVNRGCIRCHTHRDTSSPSGSLSAWFCSADLTLGMGHFKARLKKKMFNPIVPKECYYQSSVIAFNKRMTLLECTGQCKKASQSRRHLSPHLSFSTFSITRSSPLLFHFLLFSIVLHISKISEC